jgi:predicted 2-oxoglutarate/Fe(II)-dependent dioxygenase YbiX
VLLVYHICIDIDLATRQKGGGSAMAERQAKGLEIGDILPPLNGTGADGSLVELSDDSLAGRPLLLIFLRDPNHPKVEAGLARLAAWSERLAGLGCATFVFLPLLPTQALAYLQANELPFDGLADTGMTAIRPLAPALFEAHGPVLVSVLCRPNRHVQAVITDADADHGDLVCAHIETMAAQRARRAGDYHPPVLMVPDVLSPADCQRLMTVFAMQGNTYVDSAHGGQGQTQDYKMSIPDYGRNDRVDHWVINKDTSNFIAQRCGQRVIPEIKKAFQYQISKFERFRIGRYQALDSAEGLVGSAHGHRDDSELQVAHRRFACSVNLNAESFEGGGLIFPEYGGQEYSPRTGEALVFSSSLLHQVMPVTRGTRFVLLSFLFGDT